MPIDFEKTLTIFGRNPVLECIADDSLAVSKLHLSQSNKPARILDDILRHANRREIPIQYHGKQELSRISRNGKQDQGVAADVLCPGFQNWESLFGAPSDARIIALDRINNPQNLGMIIRSCCAAGIHGVLLSSEAGNTRLSPLVIKASAGTVFKTPIYKTSNLAHSLQILGKKGFTCIAMAADSGSNVLRWKSAEACIFVLGNETDGISPEVMAAVTTKMHIPMANGVESLNLAVTASLLAFLAR